MLDEYENLSGGYDPANWSRNIELDETIIDGNGEKPAVLAAGNSAIDGFTINGGYALNCEADASLTRCTFRNNGGGISIG